MQGKNNSPTSIVIGHKNPDTDSIASAVSYAEYKKLTGLNNVIAGAAGIPNARTEYLFNKFNVKLPNVFDDVSPVVGDIMNFKPFTMLNTSVILETFETMLSMHQYRIPIVDKDNSFKGMVSIFDVPTRLFRLHNRSSSILGRKVKTTVSLAARTLNAEKIAVYDENNFEFLHIYVAAMSLTGFRNLVLKNNPRNLAIIVSDREDIHFMCSELNVRLLILTGNATVSNDILQIAKLHKTSILVTKYDSATTVRRLKFATPADEMLEADDLVFSKTDKLKDIKSKVFGSIEDIFPVVDDYNKLIGIFSKTDIEIETPVQLILVDHNELGQAVQGADSVPIIEVLDHHRLDMAPTLAPVTVYNDIVGSTCTLVAEKFRISRLPLSMNIAGILLGGIITDTLLLRSPTTTDRDADILKWLESVSKVKADKLADELFNIGSTLAKVNLSDVFESDRKDFSHAKLKFSISQIEETSFIKFNLKFEGIKAQAEKILRAEKLDMVSLLVTNVLHETSVLLAVGNSKLLNMLPYKKVKDNLYDLPGVMSRKKQLLPQLLKVFDKIV